MKKLIQVFAAAAWMLLCASAACAAIPPQPLPDPNEAMDVGRFEFVASNYQFSEDYVCDAYLYDQPEDFDSFLEQYAELALGNRHRMEETTLDGMKAYAFVSYHTAYLIPDFEPGKMLLLVAEKMEFGGAAQCPDCSAGWVTCFLCNGKGTADVTDHSGASRMERKICPRCTGNGRIRCMRCDGTGEISPVRLLPNAE